MKQAFILIEIQETPTAIDRFLIVHTTATFDNGHSQVSVVEIRLSEDEFYNLFYGAVLPLEKYTSVQDYREKYYSIKER